MTDLPFPLKIPGDNEFQALCATLWDWQVCDGCVEAPSQPCRRAQCPWQRAYKLRGFFQYYKALTSSYVPESLFSSTPALSCHNDILSIVKLIQTHPDASRSSITKSFGHPAKHGSSPVASSAPLPEDKDRAFDMAVRIALMVNCSNDCAGGGLLELGTRPVTWDTSMSREHFMRMAFPQTAYPTLEENDYSSRSRQIFSGLRATRLQKIAGLRFCPTDDLHNHLRLDHRAGTVDIYHHTAVLKEHLMCSAAKHNSDSEKCHELIPRQLALEVIDSIQKVLFPSDIQSQGLLRSLVRKQGFDEDCLRYESSTYRLARETETTYSYFGARLVDLYEEVTNPTPRGLLEKWLAPRSGARHVMMVTLAGVFIAIVLGFLGLGVQIFQAWMTYKQLRLSAAAS
ncbi:hypothetical protein DL771_011558 [Monosporascus sp. 5C6A]|nr:hypothetical protein DL771_011558 [Monosporascus sp. 5C6A]